MIVYRIDNKINDKVYIGQTIRPLSHRWTQHLRDSRDCPYPLYRAIRKYGKENFTVSEIDSANSLSELNYLEKHYICKFNSLTTENGYNILPGGKKFKMPQAIRDKISKANKGRKQIPKISKEERSRICRENGKKASSKNRVEWCIKNGSKPFKVYVAICIQKRHRYQPSIYKKGECIGKWLIAKDCARDLNINSKHIGSCLNGNRKQHIGYIFERV